MVPVELEPDSDCDVAHFRFKGQGRLILDTKHGQVIIDVRGHDVNAFSLESGSRVDCKLIDK